MLTTWLTFTALLAGSVNPETAAVTVAPTCRVKGHPEEELTLNCGDGKSSGVVQFWHTPFGDLQAPGLHSKLDPVFVHHDGSLVVPNASSLHSGLYYCVLRHAEGTTLWPYELHVGRDAQESRGRTKHGRDAFRVQRDAGFEAEGQEGVSDGQFAGAVAAAVLLTFVLGFSAGALSRTRVLRCLGAVTTRLRLSRQQRSQTGSEVTMTTLPPMCDNGALEVERDDSENCVSTETTVSSTASPPPAKPQRSFRNKRRGEEEEEENTAYLEGCDHVRGEEERMEERKEGCDEETEEREEEQRGFYLLGADGGSQTETDEDECREEGEEIDGRERRKEEEEVQEEENTSQEEGDEEVGSDKEKEEEEGWREKQEKDDGETDGEKQEDTMKSDITEGGEGGGEGGGAAPSTRRRSRVIRLYQYDDDGQRYGHLPDPAPDEPGPAPRLRQRSVSLTRLGAIMAAASAGPLDTGETAREETPRFHMDI